MPSWEFLRGWTPPRTTPTWEAAAAWWSSFARITEAERAELRALRDAWDEALRDLGGDPSATDWSGFAPLRRDREEDWSSWLAQLLADSKTGIFAAELFGDGGTTTREVLRAPRVRREVPVEDRRVDILIEWSSGTYSHVEVKVGDPHLEKTPDTATKLRRAMAHCSDGVDILLVLPDQRDAWDRIRADSPVACAGIQLLTWIDVAVALRRALRAEEQENLRWRVWAHALCGAIEQELLALPAGDDPERWCRSMRLPAVAAAKRLLSMRREGEG